MTRKRLILVVMLTAIVSSGFVWWCLARPAKPPRERSEISQVVEVTQWAADGQAIVDGIVLESGKPYLIDVRFAMTENEREQATTKSVGTPVSWVWVRFASNALRNRFANQDDLRRAVQVIKVSLAQPRPTQVTVPSRPGEYELQLVVSTSEGGSMPPEMFHHGQVVASAMIQVVPPANIH